MTRRCSGRVFKMLFEPAQDGDEVNEAQATHSSGLMEAASRGAREAGGASYELKYSCAFVVMPGGLGPLDEIFEAATLIQCPKIGPFPLVLMGSKFWKGMREWGQEMMKDGVFARDEIGFGYVTDSPKEAVELIVRSLPAQVGSCLKPCG